MLRYERVRVCGKQYETNNERPFCVQRLHGEVVVPPRNHLPSLLCHTAISNERMTSTMGNTWKQKLNLF